MPPVFDAMRTVMTPPCQLPTDIRARRHRTSLALVIWCVIALLGIWLLQPMRVLRLGDARAGTDWYGIEQTPDAISFRWTAPASVLTIPAGNTGMYVLRLRLAAAAPETTLRIAVDGGAAASFHVTNGTFRTYQLITTVPLAIGDRWRVSLDTLPPVADGSRSLGVAVAALQLRPVRALPGLPPPLWILLTVASTALIGWAMQRWQPSYGIVLWAGSFALWLAGAAGVVPWSAALLAPGGVLVLCAAGLATTRRLVQQALPYERVLRRRLSMYPRLLHAGVALGFGLWAVLVWQMVPWTTQYAWVGAVHFSLTLLGMPLLIVYRQRVRGLAPWLGWLIAIGATLVLGAVFWRIYMRQLDGTMLSDLPLHMLDARRIVLHRVTVNYAVWVDGHVALTTHSGDRWVSIPHPLFHWILGLVGFLMRDTVYWRAMPVTLLLFQGLAVGMLFVVVRRMVGRRIHAAWLWVLALTLHVAAAVYVPALNPALYRGQGSMTIFHNATTIIAKPVTWLACGLLLVVMSPGRRRWLWVSLAVLALVAAALAKPNGPLAIVPAVWAVVGMGWLAGRRIPRSAWLLVLPTAAAVTVLALQSTVRSNGGSDFAIGWLRAAALSSPHPYVSLLQLCAFPLVTLLLAPPLWRDRMTLVVVAACSIAMLQYLVFYEPAQITANNFAWGLRIVIPLWHALALGWLLRLYSRPRVSIQTHMVAAVYGLHLLAGGLYLVQLLVSNTYL